MAKRRSELERSMSEAQDPRASVAADMARLKGFSRSDVVPDHKRKASSPLSHGTHSSKKKGGRK